MYKEQQGAEAFRKLARDIRTAGDQIINEWGLTKKQIPHQHSLVRELHDPVWRILARNLDAMIRQGKPFDVEDRLSLSLGGVAELLDICEHPDQIIGVRATIYYEFLVRLGYLERKEDYLTVDDDRLQNRSDELRELTGQTTFEISHPVRPFTAKIWSIVEGEDVFPVEVLLLYTEDKDKTSA